ncbi:hypothetical protein [Denitromonas iodatirespirans]|uniref:Uncharacterized protein n=1 Tax=Denitromonas iodatirespirans TaxID=2795389 RepID=A0A944D8Q8_DENI1|nr:hypothetical protein [Denitromonas iodatirespirans]MBT0959987.1 hypothetical protein [Denitromonas iodatirespirans]
MAIAPHAVPTPPPAGAPVSRSRVCRPGQCRCGCCASRLLSCVLTLTARLRGSAGASQRRTALCRGEHLARSVRGLPGAPPAA